MVNAVAFLVGWCGNEPLRLRPQRPGPLPWPWLVISILAGIAGIGGSSAVTTIIGGTGNDAVTILASMAGAFAAGRAFSSLANGFFGTRDVEVSQIG